MEDFQMWSLNNPGWGLIPHDWMWHAFWISIGYDVGVTIGGLLLWVGWLFSKEK